MQLHQIIKSEGRKSQRIGRGGKRGSFSGRGIKGQRSRAGRRIRPAERDLIIRIPKKRGFRNKPVSDRAFILNLEDLAAAKPSLAALDFAVSPETLRKIRLVPSGYRGEVKILSRGEMDFPVKLEGLKVSKGAKAKIEKAWGKVAE